MSVCSDTTPWWKGRGDFVHARPLEEITEGVEGAGSVSGGEGSTLGSMECGHQGLEKRAARFTEYSMTSSKVPRSEGE